MKRGILWLSRAVGSYACRQVENPIDDLEPTPVGDNLLLYEERPCLLLPTFSSVAARLHIEEIVARCRGLDWDECRNKLMRSFVSERE